MSASVIKMNRESEGFKVDVIESGPRFDRRFQAVGTINQRKESKPTRATFAEAVKDALALEAELRSHVSSTALVAANGSIKSQELSEGEVCREMPAPANRQFGQRQFVKNVWNMWNHEGSI